MIYSRTRLFLDKCCVIFDRIDPHHKKHWKTKSQTPNREKQPQQTRTTMESSSTQKTTTVTQHVVLHCRATGMEALKIGSFEISGGGESLHHRISQALQLPRGSWSHGSVCRLTQTSVPLHFLLDWIAADGYRLETMGMCPYDATRDEGMTYVFAKQVSLVGEEEND